LSIVIKERVKNPKGYIDYDLHRELIENALRNIFKPSEIEYYITLAKKKSLTEGKMEEIFD
jgi:hypothetical protein